MKPAVVTERDRIRGIADAWYEQYRSYIDSPERNAPKWMADKGTIYAALRALDLETCSAGDVVAVIGNDTWTNLVCNGCDEDVTAVVEVGEDSTEVDSYHARLCLTCVTEAAELLAKAAGK